MVSVVTQKFVSHDKYYVEAFGKSTDNKPDDGIVTGSVFVEVDTGKVYLYDEETDAWLELGGGGNA